MHTEIKEKPSFWGMINYTLIGDGCLNGVWSNSLKQEPDLFNEIARKVDTAIPGLAGTYHCTWIDMPDNVVSGTLVITQVRNTNSYTLTWTVEGDTWFSGVGMLLGDRSFIVTYWDGRTIQFPFITP